ncbi:hypothetical protein C7N43_13730 [Sphingobacteriales bacterium UPWRP_1]|nr:hypothetical protein BVG80_15570 [Sphingobacteriales bacterium TSM_CSM]PSJ76437.1 hypothetical protein C7N43_13730 [Sphingobacteriales bacterium UPWRP_1]
MLQNQPKQNNTKRPATDYAKYSGLAFQMIAIMLLAGFVGIKLDAFLHSSPALTIIFLLAGVAGAMYLVIKILSR